VIRVIIDTNVVVSALIASFGNESLLAGKQGLITLCLSQEIREEYFGAPTTMSSLRSTSLARKTASSSTARSCSLNLLRTGSRRIPGNCRE